MVERFIARKQAMIEKITNLAAKVIAQIKKQNLCIIYAVIAAFAILLLKFISADGVAIGSFYIILVLAGRWASRRSYIFLLAGAASLLLFIGQETVSSVEHGAIGFINRSLALSAIWMTAFIVGRLWDRKTLLQAVVDTAAEGIIMIDAHGTISSFNKMAETIFGYAADEVIAQNVSLLMPAPYREKHDEFLSAYLHGGPAKILGQYREVRGLRKNGEIFPLLLGVTEVKLGNESHFTGIVRDITQRKKNEAAILAAKEDAHARAEELSKANEELSQFAHVVSHDLKAPLRAIHNYSDWLAEDLQGTLSEDNQEYIQGLQQAVNQAEVLIEDLLALSKIGRSETRNESIALKNFFSDLLASLHLKDDEVKVEIGKRMPTISSSPILLTQIFQNLILNGIKYNRSEKKLITISYKKDHLCHNITVKDNGIGIDPKYHASIFDIFQRLHTRDEYDGTGIGLAIVKKAAHQLGYTVSLESVQDQGSAFTLHIPINGD